MNKGQAFSVYGPSRDTAYIRTITTVSVTAFLVSRAFILENTMPFGIAFLSAALLNRCMPLPALLSASLGVISALGLRASYKYLAVMGVLYIILGIILRKRPLKRYIVSLMTFCTMLTFSGLWLNPAGGYAPLDMLIIGFEALAASILMYIFDYAFPAIMDSGGGRHSSKEEAVCMAIVLSVTVSGLGTLRLWHISVKTIVMAVIITIGGYTGGAAMGSAAGALLGLASGFMTAGVTAMVGVFSFAGLLAGTFRELGRAGSLLGFIIGGSILNFYMGGGTASVINMEELLLSSLLFILIPVHMLNGFGLISDGKYSAQDRVPYHVKAKEFASIRLKEFAGVFEQLSATFSDVSFKEDFLGAHSLHRLMDDICNSACKDCSFQKTCWETNFHTSYRSMFELLCTAEEKGPVTVEHIPETFRKTCIRPDQIIESVNRLFSLFRINYRWQLRMEDCRDLVSQQLKGMADVVENLAGEMDMHLNFNEDLEKSISKALSVKGIEVNGVVAIEKPGRGTEVYLDKKACYGCRECIKKIIPEISAVTGKRFGRSGYLCDIKKGTCSLKLVEARKFNVSTGVCAAPKDESWVSGDNYTFMELKDHRYLIALSDGMGTGVDASAESSMAINLLEQLLEAGYGHDRAVNTINSIMMMRSPGDNFSTLDIALIDLYNGEVKIIKTGAPPTFIKRGREVRVLASSSLPVGIVDKVDFYTKKLSVAEGDFIVMVTDGIAEANGGVQNDEWIADILRNTDNLNPQEIARIVFEEAINNYGDRARDDMTVLVSKVWKNS